MQPRFFKKRLYHVLFLQIIIFIVEKNNSFQATVDTRAGLGFPLLGLSPRRARCHPAQSSQAWQVSRKWLHPGVPSPGEVTLREGAFPWRLFSSGRHGAAQWPRQDQRLETGSKPPPTKGVFLPVSRAVLVPLPGSALPPDDRLRRETALSVRRCGLL